MTPSYLNTVQGVTQLYEIMDSTEIGDSQNLPQNRWWYTVRPVTLQAIGGQNASLVKGHSGDAPYLRAWNIYESENDQNRAAGVFLDGLKDGWTMQPIRDGTVVPGWYYQGGEGLSILLAWPNQFEGPCDD